MKLQRYVSYIATDTHWSSQNVLSWLENDGDNFPFNPSAAKENKKNNNNNNKKKTERERENV